MASRCDFPSLAELPSEFDAVCCSPGKPSEPLRLDDELDDELDEDELLGIDGMPPGVDEAVGIEGADEEDDDVLGIEGADEEEDDVLGIDGIEDDEDDDEVLGIEGAEDGEEEEDELGIDGMPLLLLELCCVDSQPARIRATVATLVRAIARAGRQRKIAMFMVASVSFERARTRKFHPAAHITWTRRIML